MNNNTTVRCDTCGDYVEIYTTYGGYNFCSTECKNHGIKEIEGSNGADLYDSQRDFELEDSIDEILNDYDAE